MPGRTPNFIIVGVFIIILLVGIFYMSCSSRTTELQQALESFEERIRSLAMKNTEKEKEIGSISATISELESQKTNIQKQMDKKDSEINDLITKLNERKAQIESLMSDKQILDTQLKEFKTVDETLASKNSAIEKLQKELDEEKKSNDEKLNQLKQEIDSYKKQINQTQNSQENSLIIPNQRFQPLLSPNETIKTSSLEPQEFLAQLSRIKRESKENVSSSLGSGNNSLANQMILTNNKQLEQLQLSQKESISVLSKNGSAGSSFTYFRHGFT
ncbi:unnamed protein product [Rotaria sp. Silwood1]|nr:unnamed protein product [Rotaria sp. Silwood1]CAF4899152.1 unnamed protein product [Rotaria sp. Silwood1]